MHMFVVFLGTCVGLNFTCVDLFHIVVILCDIFLHVSCVVFGTSVVHSRVASIRSTSPPPSLPLPFTPSSLPTPSPRKIVVV